VGGLQRRVRVERASVVERDAGVGRKRAEELLDPEKGKYREREFVLIDESHNFRSSKTNRYEALQKFLEGGDPEGGMLTATPRNSTAWDVYHQIKLFQPRIRH